MRPARHLPAFAFVIVAAACGFETDTAMHETIEMGPFAFAIEDVYEQPQRPCSVIYARLRLAESKDAKVHFDDFLNDNTSQKMIIHPAMEIVDGSGGKTMGWVSRVSGRDQWSAKFDPRDSDGCEVNGHLPDLRLTIRNPDRRGGQPSRVSIALK